jgi:hypothetical protein
MPPSSSLSSHPAFAGMSAAQLPAAGGDKAGRRLRTRSRLRRSDQIIGISSLLGAAAAMPLAASPEGAAVLAVAAIALLAGERWAIGLVIVAELALLGALLPFLLKQPPPFQTAAAWLSVAAAFPAMAVTRRGAAALALLSGLRRTPTTCRAFHLALLGLAVFAGCAPLI